jgi:prepilin-type N-terminal cleavage/methylation domain-containing protein
MNEKAFTLIEVIVCLVLIGIMAAIVGMGFMRIAEGYIFAKKNAETVQKAQVAIARIVKELSTAQKASGAASAISTTVLPTTTSVTYTRLDSANISTTYTITLADNQALITTGAASGILMNSGEIVTADSLFLYYDGSGTAISPTSANVPTIRRIVLKLTVNGANSTQIPFDNNNIFLQEF